MYYQEVAMRKLSSLFVLPILFAGFSFAAVAEDMNSMKKEAIETTKAFVKQLGGAMTHNSVSGVAHFAANSDTECLATIRRLLSFIPSNNSEQPPVQSTDDPLDREMPELDGLVPTDGNKKYWLSFRTVPPKVKNLTRWRLLKLWKSLMVNTSVS